MHYEMSHPYQASASQSLSAELPRRGAQAIALATVSFACMLLFIFLKQGELRIEDAGNILIFILPIHLALGWYVTPSMWLYLPVLVFIAIVSWVIMLCLAPAVGILHGRIPALVLKIVGVVLVDLSLAVGAAVFQLLKNRFVARLSD